MWFHAYFILFATLGQHDDVLYSEQIALEMELHIPDKKQNNSANKSLFNYLTHVVS